MSLPLPQGCSQGSPPKTTSKAQQTPHCFGPARGQACCDSVRGSRLETAGLLRSIGGGILPRPLVASQRSLHYAPIFRLLLKVAVKGTHQCDLLNFCGGFWSPTILLLVLLLLKPSPFPQSSILVAQSWGKQSRNILLITVPARPLAAPACRLVFASA